MEKRDIDEKVRNEKNLFPEKKRKAKDTMEQPPKKSKVTESIESLTYKVSSVILT
jgi:hypothetical protein